MSYEPTGINPEFAAQHPNWTMTAILDTDKPLKCGSCKELIHPAQSKVILGYSSLIIVMHADCWEIEEVLRK